MRIRIHKVIQIYQKYKEYKILPGNKDENIANLCNETERTMVQTLASPSDSQRKAYSE